jgi:hypothetical protein
MIWRPWERANQGCDIGQDPFREHVTAHVSCVVAKTG